MYGRTTSGLMSQQNVTYWSYIGMHSFKVIVGVAPTGVITYVSKLYPCSLSDKSIVQQSGLLQCGHSTHFSHFFRIIQSAACLITRPLHYLLSDLFLIEFARDGGNIRGIYVVTITIPKHEIGTTFASVWNKGFPLETISSLHENRRFGLILPIFLYCWQKDVYWRLS